METLGALGRHQPATARELAGLIEGSPPPACIAYHLRAMRRLGLVEPVDGASDPADPDSPYKLSEDPGQEQPEGDDG